MVVASAGRGRKVVLVLGGGAVTEEEEEAGSLRTVALEHPRGGRALFLRRGSKLFEVQRRAVKKHGSWFVGNDVVRDGGLVVASPFDARFLVLALLSQQQRRDAYVPMDDVVSSACNESRDALVLLDLDLGDLTQAFDVNPKHADLRLVKLDEDRVLDWLAKKVETAAAVLKGKHHLSSSSSSSSEGVSSSAFRATSAAAAVAADDGRPTAKDYLRAVQAVSDCVSDEWAAKLAARFGLDLADSFAGVKRTRPAEPAGGADHGTTQATGAWSYDAKAQELHEVAFGAQTAKKQKVELAKGESTKQKQLAKAAKNTKPIGSFFKPKKLPASSSS